MGLKTLRQARGWSQLELAERAGVTQAMICYFENDRPAPKGLLTARRLARALGVSVDALWDDPECPQPPETAPTTVPTTSRTGDTRESA